MNESKELEEFVTMSRKSLEALEKKVEEKISSNKNCPQIARKNFEKNPENELIVSIKDVPKGQLFSRNSIWRATNLTTMLIFELSGWNVDLYIGENSTLRTLLESGLTDSFQYNGLFIQFHHYSK